MTTAPAIILGRCNPYGAESGGPKHVMGGLHGPASAALARENYPGVPENVQQGEWACNRPAVIRVRMTCQCGHRGEPMSLCSWSDQVVYHGELVAGTVRRVSETIRTPGHYEEITKRQCGACIRCLYPGRYADDYKALFRHQQELAFLRDTGQWYTPRAAAKRQVIEDMVKQFDQGNADGTIHRCPMTLVPVS